MATISADSLFAFRNGDVRIKVTYHDKLIIGKVCSHAMVLVSRPWENFMFDPRHRHNLQTNGHNVPDDLEDPPSLGFSACDGQYALTSSAQRNTTRAPAEEVDFTEDDGEALLILLCITHLQFDRVPASITFETLLTVSILCDQYDCVKLVQPWLLRWLPEHEPSALDIGHESWLWIAWVVGHKEIFERLAIKMVRTVRTGDDGMCLTANGERIADPMPPGIIERILEIRQETIDCLLSIPHDRLAKYETARETVCHCSHGRAEECDAIIFGSVHLGLKTSGLWPRKRADQVRLSVDDIASKLNGIHVSSVQENCKCSCHDTCRGYYSIQWQVELALQAIESPMLESHLRHFEAQK